jgi:hypothetical protein
LDFALGLFIIQHPDANGNLTADNAHAYLYDVENRLVEMRARVGTVCPSASGGYTGQIKVAPPHKRSPRPMAHSSTKPTANRLTPARKACPLVRGKS